MQEHRLTDQEFSAVGRRLDELVQEFEALPFPEIREKVFDLLRTVDALHREGLTRLISSLREDGQEGLVDQAADDMAIRTLLLLYDLAPPDPVMQAEVALASVRPYIRSHGGEVEVLDVVEGVVHLRMSGSCEGCPASAVTLKRGIEAALREGLPGFRGTEVHEPEPVSSAATSFIPLKQVTRWERQVRRPVFKEIARIEEVPPGTMRMFEVDGMRVLTANVGGDVYAVRDQCPGSMAPLSLGSFSPPIVVCPWHNEAYDIRTGKRMDGSQGSDLTVLPIALGDGVIRLAVNVEPTATTRAGR